MKHTSHTSDSVPPGTMRRLLSALGSTRALYCYFLFTLILPNILLSVTEHFNAAAAAVNILLPLAVYGLLMTGRNIGRTVWFFFPIVFLAAFQIVLLGLYGRSVIAADMFLNLSSTNPGEAGELLGNILPVVLLVAVLYLPSLVMGIVLWKRHKPLPRLFRIKARRVWSGVGIVSVMALGVAFLSDRAYSMHDDLYPVNAAYNLSLAVRHSERVRQHERLAKDFRFDTHSTRADSLREVYVLVVGETSRADHWQINGYGRPTNPLLSQRNDIYTFPHAMSESNTTHKSVPLLLSHLRADEFGDSIYSVRSVISAFREAGYQTAFLSTQEPNGALIESFGAEADTTIYVGHLPGHGHSLVNDLELLPLLRHVVAQGAQKQLIVLHSYGSHFSYRDRYPQRMAAFLPDDYKAANPGERTRLVNAYDNTLLVTDRLLDGVVQCLSQCGADRAAMVYTSDHGEDLYDDSRRLFLHASPCPTYWQLHVPFVVWLSPELRQAEPGIAIALRANRNKEVSSSASFFDTAMQLAGLDTPRSAGSESLASRRYHHHEACFLNDHNRAVALGHYGFSDLQPTLAFK